MGNKHFKQDDHAWGKVLASHTCNKDAMILLKVDITPSADLLEQLVDKLDRATAMLTIDVFLVQTKQNLKCNASHFAVRNNMKVANNRLQIDPFLALEREIPLPDEALLHAVSLLGRPGHKFFKEIVKAILENPGSPANARILARHLCAIRHEFELFYVFDIAVNETPITQAALDEINFLQVRAQDTNDAHLADIFAAHPSMLRRDGTTTRVIPTPINWLSPAVIAKDYDTDFFTDPECESDRAAEFGAWDMLQPNSEQILTPEQYARYRFAYLAFETTIPFRQEIGRARELIGYDRVLMYPLFSGVSSAVGNVGNAGSSATDVPPGVLPSSTQSGQSESPSAAVEPKHEDTSKELESFVSRFTEAGQMSNIGIARDLLKRGSMFSLVQAVDSDEHNNFSRAFVVELLQGYAWTEAERKLVLTSPWFRKHEISFERLTADAPLLLSASGAGKRKHIEIENDDEEVQRALAEAQEQQSTEVNQEMAERILAPEETLMEEELPELPEEASEEEQEMNEEDEGETFAPDEPLQTESTESTESKESKESKESGELESLDVELPKKKKKPPKPPPSEPLATRASSQLPEFSRLPDTMEIQPAEPVDRRLRVPFSQWVDMAESPTGFGSLILVHVAIQPRRMSYTAAQPKLDDATALCLSNRDDWKYQVPDAQKNIWPCFLFDPRREILPVALKRFLSQLVSDRIDEDSLWFQTKTHRWFCLPPSNQRGNVSFVFYTRASLSFVDKSLYRDSTPPATWRDILQACVAGNSTGNLPKKFKERHGVALSGKWPDTKFEILHDIDEQKTGIEFALDDIRRVAIFQKENSGKSLKTVLSTMLESSPEANPIEDWEFLQFFLLEQQRAFAFVLSL
jgi:hypothetical protein